MRNVIRTYCVFVLLDKPKKKSFRAFLGFCRRGKSLWLAPRVPLWARLLGTEPLLMPQSDALLLWELERLAQRYEGKILTLVPLSQKANRFIETNEAQLAISYRLERTPK